MRGKLDSLEKPDMQYLISKQEQCHQEADDLKDKLNSLELQIKTLTEQESELKDCLHRQFKLFSDTDLIPYFHFCLSVSVSVTEKCLAFMNFSLRR